MGGHIVELLSSPHRAAEALMPWLLNGTLGPAERRRLEGHLRDCADCRAELQRQRRLATLYRQSTAQPDIDCDGAFARLASRLDEEAGRVPARPQRRPKFGWGLVAALQFCLIAALVWTVWLLRPESPESSSYRGLAATAAATGGDAIVIFAAETTESEIRRVLHRAGARIVDGPMAEGGYVLQFERNDTLAALRSERSVLRVERLAAAGAPEAVRRRN